jgi:phage gp29-like protein
MNIEPTFNALAIEREIQSRFNPLPGLTPDGLARQIDEFRAGYLHNLALTMDVMEERDDLLAAVVPKAKAAPTIHGWEINTVNTRTDGEAKKAAEQKATLEYFYNNLRATSAIEQDMLGDIYLLLEQMMDAKGKRYSCHNLVWKSNGRGRYTVTAHHVPLWFFEARTGKLRFLNKTNNPTGEDLKPGAWLVSVGKGLMIPCAVAWMFKHLPLRDWLLYCRRHGLPGIEGVTDAISGTAEYDKLRTAVLAAAGGEFAWIRSQNQQINKIDFGAEGDLPFPALVDRMDRAMAAIWRGGDLSTMSKDKQAVGAHGQKKEADIIAAKDANWLSEQLNMRLDRLVLDYTFGENEPALAYITIKPPPRKDLELDLAIDSFAVRNGHPISRKQFAERYNRPLPKANDELLRRVEVKVLKASLSPASAVNSRPDDRQIVPQKVIKPKEPFSSKIRKMIFGRGPLTNLESSNEESNGQK